MLVCVVPTCMQMIYVDVYHSNIQAGLASKDKFEPSSPKGTERYLFTYSFIHL